MADIKRSTVMTLQEVDKAMLRARDEGRFEDAFVLRQLGDAYAKAGTYQSNEKLILLNPLSPSNSDSYKQVHQLIEDLSFQAVPLELRQQIVQLESKLPQ